MRLTLKIPIDGLLVIRQILQPVSPWRRSPYTSVINLVGTQDERDELTVINNVSFVSSLLQFQSPGRLQSTVIHIVCNIQTEQLYTF